jgi:hypothetical protein
MNKLSFLTTSLIKMNVYIDLVNLTKTDQAHLLNNSNPAISDNTGDRGEGRGRGAERGETTTYHAARTR